MPQHQLVGTRIRERRLDRGMRQADLATRAGISASYLNLIEHNRRRIAGKLLNEIARALGVEAAVLAQGAERATLDRLQAAAARSDPGAAPPETDRVEEFAARFPGWAGVLTRQDRQIAALEGQVRALGDRLAHDPDLARALHEVISSVTSIRSTSSILAGTDRLDADWQDRFHRNLYDDAQRLAESSRTLVNFLETQDEATQGPMVPVEEVDAFLATRTGALAALEAAPDAKGVGAVMAQAGALTAEGRELLLRRLERRAEDIRALPLGPLSEAAHEEGHDPGALAARLGAGLDLVLRRLATLPAERGHPLSGLAICDGAGALVAQKPLGDLALPRVAAGCPYWPLYEALSRPGVPIRARVTLAGSPGPGYLCHAYATPADPPRFDAPARLEAVMLVTAAADDGAAPAREAGLTCRICPRADCPARREPSALSGPAAREGL